MAGATPRRESAPIVWTTSMSSRRIRLRHGRNSSASAVFDCPRSSSTTASAGCTPATASTTSSGLVKGTAGLHHYSFEVPDFTCYLKLGDLLDRANKQVLWGPGRHRPGDNTYAYYTDASGAMIECSGGMAMIANDATFQPNVITNLARPGNVREMNVWGTPAPAEWREYHFPFARI